MEPEKATISVPLSEWNELRSVMVQVVNALNQLNSNSSNELLTPAQVCKMLNISRSSFERLVARNAIVPVRIQKKKYTKVLIKKSEVEELLHNGDV